MQIESIVLYNKDGEQRVLSFNVGRVNIISGESKTGKSALIGIIDYCLGSKDCNVPEGIIRDTVQWFGIRLNYENEQVFIARPNPNILSQASTQQIYLSTADTVEIPSLNELHYNSDIISLKNFLTKKLQISDYKEASNTSDEGLTVNFKHSRLYCFQPQDLIAQRNFLFYNSQEPFVLKDIKITLPYFLGAIREDAVRIEQNLNEKKKELTSLEKQLKNYEQIKNEGSQKISELINDAKQLNLISVDREALDLESSIEILKEISKWEENFNEIAQGENENLKKLLEEKLQLEKSLGLVRDNIKAVNAFASQTSDYSSEVTQQKARLESINLFTEEDSHVNNCPLCNQHLDVEIPTVLAIRKSLTDLTENLDTTLAEKPKLNSYIGKLTEQELSLKLDIELRSAGIKAIYREKEEALTQKDDNIRRGKILGKVILFLESYKELEKDASLVTRIEKLKETIILLEATIGYEEKQEKINSILNLINNQMTEWKKNLDLEYQNAPIRFDLNKLTLFADTPNKSIPLNQMGSGANWVAYHLLIHFALHKHFVDSDRPVPRFIILDQPSQAYYPPDQEREDNGAIIESSDETAVKQIYDFILAVTEELSPKFQVIITDHAKLNYDNFTVNIVEEWRNGNKLIPETWISNDSDEN